MFPKRRFPWLLLGASALFAQSAGRLHLGRLETGDTVSFARSMAGAWGIEISGAAAPCIGQPQPAKLEVDQTADDLRHLSSGYKAVQKTAAGIDARAEISYGDGVVSQIDDHASPSGPVLSGRALLRKTVQLDRGPTLPRCRTRPAARHEIHGRSAGASVRRKRDWLAAGGLAHEARLTPGRRRPPLLAALGFGKPSTELSGWRFMIPRCIGSYPCRQRQNRSF